MKSESRLLALAARFPVVERWYRSVGIDPRTHDFSGAKNFLLSLLLLGVSLVLALNGAAAFERGHKQLMVVYHALALALAFFVAVRLVPRLAAGTPLRWLFYQVDFKLTREGLVYLAVTLVLVIAALNTGNNLLFIVLASLLAGILVSGLVSRIVLTGIDLSLELPEHIFARQPVRATLTLQNHKRTLPSFSLTVSGDTGGSRKRRKKAAASGEARRVLRQPVYFPYIPRHRSSAQAVELTFPRRGRYAQDAFKVSSKFPFGFLLKTRQVKAANELVVYPPVAPTEEFYEILPLLSGELESYYRGQGHDLYSIRDYQPTDSARHVDWKATARAQNVKVREFAREDERRVELVFDPYLPPEARPAGGGAEWEEKFERAVSFCACLAWHFYEINAQLKFSSPKFTTPVAPATDNIYHVLRELAFVEPEWGSDDEFLAPLSRDTNTFKLLLTARERGSIPTTLWANSYVVFFQSL